MGMQLPTAKVSVRPVRNVYYKSEQSSESVVWIEKYVKTTEVERVGERSRE